MVKLDKWSIIVYLLIISVVVWFFLKSVGVIHSPAFIELYPFFALAVGGGIAYGKITTTLKHISRRVNRLPEMNERLTKMETTCDITHRRKKRK